MRNRLKLINKKIVLYAGSLRSGKGVDNIIEVAKNLENNKEIYFYVVGGPQDLKEMYVNKVKSNNISFLGFINPKDVPKYLKAADCLLMLYSKTEKNRIMDLNTTSPIKLFEYLASKKPIVVTNVPTISKIVSDKEVYLSEIDDIKDISKKIKKALYYDNDKKIISAYKLVKKHTYIQRVKSIISFIYQ